MNAIVTRVSRPRKGRVLKAPAVLAVVGLALLWAQPAVARGATAPGVSAPACTVTWTGQGSQPLWTIPQNWSTGVVPRSASDVCIDTADVQVNVSIAVHSLLIGSQAEIDLNGTAAHPLTANVATAVSLVSGTAGGNSKIYLTDATIHAAQINDTSANSFINSVSGTNRLATPDLVVSNFGWLNVFSGKLIVTSLPPLANGTLTGGNFVVGLNSVLVLPGDVTRLVSANVEMTGPNEIQDQTGHNALVGLTSIDARSSLLAGNVDLALNGSLTASGDESVGTLTVKGSCTLGGGALSVGTLRAGQVVIGKGVTLGASAITGNVINSGTVAAPATVTGSYTQALSGSLNVFGGPLAVSGKATLSGSVDTSGTMGATVPLVTFASRSGNFTSHGLGFILVTKANQIDAVIEPQIAATPATTAPGGAVTVNGAGFPAGAQVSVFLDVASGTPLATTTLRPDRGAFTVPATIPASTKAGTHKLIAVVSNVALAQTTITVS